MKLYRTTRGEWIDPWGRSHGVDQVVETCDVIQAGTIPKNNGYYSYDARVAVDVIGGRVFWKPQTIDYWGTPTWMQSVGRTPTGSRWVDRLSGPTVDIDGTPIVKED